MASERHTTAVGFDPELGDKPVGLCPVSIISYKSSLKIPELSQGFH